MNVMARISNGEMPSLHQMGDAMGEHAGLSRARAGDHEQRSVAVRDRVELRRVQAGERVGIGHLPTIQVP